MTETAVENGQVTEEAEEALVDQSRLPTHFVIERALAQALLDYLVTKPYGEVSNLANSLRNLTPVDLVEDEAEKDGPEEEVEDKAA